MRQPLLKFYLFLGIETVISPLKDGKVKVSFKEKQRAITKGQSVVFYQGNKVVGGGIIAGII